MTDTRYDFRLKGKPLFPTENSTKQLCYLSPFLRFLSDQSSAGIFYSMQRATESPARSARGKSPGSDLCYEMFNKCLTNV